MFIFSLISVSSQIYLFIARTRNIWDKKFESFNEIILRVCGIVILSKIWELNKESRI